MHPMLNTAVRAARRAGDIITRSLMDVQDIQVEEKGFNDYVSEVDRRAEAAILEILLNAYPEHAVLAEEGGGRDAPGNAPYRWIIDPLDGTTNFLHGHPQFCVSIGLEHEGKLDQAVIYDPLRQELFTASRGAGAQLNNRRIRVSRTMAMQRALLGTGFPFRDETWLDTYLSTFRDLFMKTSGIRRAGSAALDLAYVAAGRFDGFWEFNLQPWDMAAGILLIQEAGGIVSDPKGAQMHMESGHIVAANPKIHKQLLVVISTHYLKHTQSQSS